MFGKANFVNQNLRFRVGIIQQQISRAHAGTLTRYYKPLAFNDGSSQSKPSALIPSQCQLDFRKSSSSIAENHNRDLPAYKPPRKGILSMLPSSWVPYAELMRIEKPGGLYGFYFPYLIGLGYAACIAQPTILPISLISTGGILLVWTVILRGAACTINDNLDRDFDRLVARCRLRPIARGAVTRAQGHIFYAAETVVAAAIVTQLPHNTECFHHAVPILALLSIYPLAKRVTDFPQVVLCIPLAWGILMSCSALGVDPFTVQNTAFASATSCLVASNAIWLIMLDYVNACQDSADDIKAGVRSMAVRYQNTTAFLSVLSTAQVSLMIATGVLANLSAVYFIVACGGNAALLAFMAKTVNRERPDSCAWWFLNGSLLVGGTTVAGLFGEYLKNLLMLDATSKADEKPRKN